MRWMTTLFCRPSDLERWYRPSLMYFSTCAMEAPVMRMTNTLLILTHSPKTLQAITLTTREAYAKLVINTPIIVAGEVMTMVVLIIATTTIITTTTVSVMNVTRFLVPLCALVQTYQKCSILPLFTKRQPGIEEF